MAEHLAVNERVLGSSPSQGAMHYTRAMFLADRTPKQIIDFMEWIEENRDERKFEWFKFWTMKTVHRWLPDYLSGRLTDEEEDDGGYQHL